MVGFVVLAVVYPLICLMPGGKGMTMTQWVLEGYYIFFTLFMLGDILKLKLIHDYCGFLKEKFWKSIFFLL